MATDADITFLRPAAYHGLILFTASAVLAFQFVKPGYYYYAWDDAATVSRYVNQIIEALSQRAAYPGWLAEEFGGYGSPTFLFYSPILYFLAAILQAAGIGTTASLSILYTFALYVGGLFVFLFMRERYGDRTSIAGALCYMLLPSRMIDQYTLGSPAARFAQALLPAALYFTNRLIASPFDRKRLAGFGLSYTALVLSHIATAYLFTPFIAAYGLIVSGKDARTASMFKLGAGLVVGLGISGFFFIPVMLERGYTSLDLLSMYYGYASEWDYPYLIHSALRTAHPNNMLAELGRWMLYEGCAVLLLYFLFVRRYADARLGREGRFFLVAAALCLFMMSEPSNFLWKNVPGLPSVAYPFRFETIYHLFLSYLSGIVIASYLQLPKQFSAVKLLSGALIPAILVIDYSLILRMPPISEADINRFAEQKTSIQVEYRPAGVELEQLTDNNSSRPLLSSTEDIRTTVIKWDHAYRSFSTEAPHGGTLRVRTFFFPGWKAWVDGKGTEIGVEKGSGAMLITVPAGSHTVELRFNSTPPRTAGWLTSLLTLALLLLPYRRIKALLRRG